MIAFSYRLEGQTCGEWGVIACHEHKDDALRHLQLYAADGDTFVDRLRVVKVMTETIEEREL